LQRIIVQIYEVQTPLEAEALIELDVDHIGSVVVSEEHWKLPQLKDTIKTIHSTAAKSSARWTTINRILSIFVKPCRTGTIFGISVIN
jgi:hypothetical protein